MDLIIFLLSTIGLTFIITQSYIFKPIRNYLTSVNKSIGKLIHCSQCTGFYIGIILQFIIVMFNRNDIIFYISDFYYIIYGFIGSFVSYTSYLLLKPFMDKYD